MTGENTPNELIAIEPELEGGGSTWWYVCGECHGTVELMAEECPHCRRRLDWNGFRGIYTKWPMKERSDQ